MKKAVRVLAACAAFFIAAPANAGWYFEILSVASGSLYFKPVGTISECMSNITHVFSFPFNTTYAGRSLAVYPYAPTNNVNFTYFYQDIVFAGYKDGTLRFEGINMLVRPCEVTAGDIPYQKVPVEMIEALNPELSVQDALALWGLGMVFLGSIWAGKRIYTLFSRDIE